MWLRRMATSLGRSGARSISIPSSCSVGCSELKRGRLIEIGSCTVTVLQCPAASMAWWRGTPRRRCRRRPGGRTALSDPSGSIRDSGSSRSPGQIRRQPRGNPSRSSGSPGHPGHSGSDSVDSVAPLWVQIRLLACQIATIQPQPDCDFLKGNRRPLKSSSAEEFLGL